MRRLLGLRPAPEFEAWLQRAGVFAPDAPRLADGGPAGALCGSAGAGLVKPPVVDQPWAVPAPLHGRAHRAWAGPAPACRPPPISPSSRPHAEARDAVHTPLDAEARCSRACARWASRRWHVRSRAADRAVYLQRPDLGRRLERRPAAALLAGAAGCRPVDLAFVLADGLSALALQRQALPLFARPARAACCMGRRLDLGAARRRDAGPRGPGRRGRCKLLNGALRRRADRRAAGPVSAPDSLGVYFSWAPRVGLVDAQRNCISNVRPEGLPPVAAAAKLHALLREVRTRQLSGVELKDEQDDRALAVASSGLMQRAGRLKRRAGPEGLVTTASEVGPNIRPGHRLSEPVPLHDFPLLSLTAASLRPGRRAPRRGACDGRDPRQAARRRRQKAQGRRRARRTRGDHRRQRALGAGARQQGLGADGLRHGADPGLVQRG